MARELVRLGYQVTIYALHPDFENLDQKFFVENNLRVRYVAPMHVRKKGNRKTYYSTFGLLFVALGAVIGLTRAALRDRPDVIWVGKPHPMNGIAGIIGKIFWNCSLILDCDDDESGSGNFRYAWQRRVVRWFEYWLPALADRVTVNTMHTYENITRQGVPGEKIIYLPNGIDVDRFSQPAPADEVELLKKALHLVGTRVISYIGTMSVSSHSVDLLIDAFKELVQLQTDARLLLVGGGEDFDLLRSQVNNLELETRVIFTGHVQPEKVKFYYQVSEVTVDPVFNNTAAKGRSPLKMFEAWACGVPFVTAAVGDRETLAGTPSAAFFVTAGDSSALAEGLNNLLSDPVQRNELVSLGYGKLKEYTWRRLIERVNCFLTEMSRRTL